MLIDDGKTHSGSELITTISRTVRQFLEQHLPEAQRPSALPAALELEDERATALTAFARRVYRSRRLLPGLIGINACDGAAWDILLDLFIAHEEGRQVSLSSLCIAADVPAATGLRYIHKLGTEGYLVRKDDPADPRRIFVEMTEATAGRMRVLLTRMERHQPPRH